jgi:hypothetical protein
MSQAPPKRLRDLSLRDLVSVQETDDLRGHDSRHTGNPGLYVVLVDAEGTPTAVTTSEDISLGFPPEDLFLADEEMPVLRLKEMRLQLESQGFSTLGVMRGRDILGIVPVERLQEDMILDAANTPGDARYRCRRYPSCSCEKTIPLADVLPLCGISAAHGHMVLVG